MLFFGALIAVDGPFLSVADRKIAVGSERGFVDICMERAVHRFDIILRSVDIDREVHVFIIETEMSRCLPEVCLADMRRDDEIVTGFFRVPRTRNFR